MKLKQDWDNSDLTDYLLYGNWSAYQGWCLLAGADGNNDSVPLDSDLFKCTTTDDQKEWMGYLELKIDRLRNFWLADELSNENKPPLFFIEWALSKRFRPEWLDWAIEKGLYTEKQAATIDIALLPFDVKSEFYPPELDIALRAWQAVSANNGKSKPKTQIKDWLNSCELKINGKKLSNDAKERISTVANWDKFGGATRTE